MGERPGLLYHYTTSEGLVGIVSTHSLWATEAAFLNDFSEFSYGEGVIKSAVQFLHENVPGTIPSTNRPCVA